MLLVSSYNFTCICTCFEMFCKIVFCYIYIYILKKNPPPPPGTFCAYCIAKQGKQTLLNGIISIIGLIFFHPLCISLPFIDWFMIEAIQHESFISASNVLPL